MNIKVQESRMYACAFGATAGFNRRGRQRSREACAIQAISMATQAARRAAIALNARQQSTGTIVARQGSLRDSASAAVTTKQKRLSTYLDQSQVAGGHDRLKGVTRQSQAMPSGDA